MKRKLMALLLTGSFVVAGSAHAAGQNAVVQGHGYSSSQVGSLPAWNNPPDMDPNFAGVVIPLGRMFATWIVKNHKTTWPLIVGLLGYPKALDDGTLDGDWPEPPESESFTEDEWEACNTYHSFNDASAIDQASGLDEGYGEEYDLDDEDMSEISWFCSNYNAP